MSDFSVVANSWNRSPQSRVHREEKSEELVILNSPTPRSSRSWRAHDRLKGKTCSDKWSNRRPLAQWTAWRCGSERKASWMYSEEIGKSTTSLALLQVIRVELLSLLTSMTSTNLASIHLNKHHLIKKVITKSTKSEKPKTKRRVRRKNGLSFHTCQSCKAPSISSLVRSLPRLKVKSRGKQTVSLIGQKQALHRIKT